MPMGRCVVQTLCLLAVIVAESREAGRRLRIRTVDHHEDNGSQLPLPPLPAGSAASNRPPVVHFLFLATNGVNNVDVWNAFLAQAPKEKYRAYVHCATPQCTVSVAGSPLMIIPTVPSYYCADLVTPMNQLLTQALQGDGQGRNPADKFVFVSDSTLPAKPFQHIYDTLVARTGSDFCVCNMKEWATRREPATPAMPGLAAPAGKPVEMAVKHHQWSVLERSHAEKVAAIWSAGPQLVHDFLLRFQMNLAPRSRTAVKTFSGSSNTGCLDEFYHMAAVYGTLPYVEPESNQSVSLAAFTNSPLRVAASVDLQGSCDTFVAWPEYAKGRDAKANATENNSFTRLYKELDPLSVPYTGDAMKPGYWDTISSHGMRAIRDSDFLFARKFSNGPKVADGGNFGQMYPDIVFH